MALVKDVGWLMVPLGNELIAGLRVNNRPDGPNALRYYRVPLVQFIVEHG